MAGRHLLLLQCTHWLGKDGVLLLLRGASLAGRQLLLQYGDLLGESGLLLLLLLLLRDGRRVLADRHVLPDERHHVPAAAEHARTR